MFLGTMAVQMLEWTPVLPMGICVSFSLGVVVVASLSWLMTTFCARMMDCGRTCVALRLCKLDCVSLMT